MSTVTMCAVGATRDAVDAMRRATNRKAVSEPRYDRHPINGRWRVQWEVEA